VAAGERFGRWTALEDARVAANRIRFRCDCGTERVLVPQGVRSGDSRSCGCYRDEVTRRHSTKHGLSGHPLYHTWYDMVDRCANPESRAWGNYGGRGITVCERWLGAPEGLAAFIADMGPKPSPLHTLDRRDNGLGYSRENCRWATKPEQMGNRRPNITNAEHAAVVAENERLRELLAQAGGVLPPELVVLEGGAA
jgi:hypothetical protein